MIRKEHVDHNNSGITKEEYANKIKRSGTYGSYIELLAIAQETNLAFAIYLADTKWKQYKDDERWVYVRREENEEPDAVIYLKLYQGNNTNEDCA